MPSSAVPSGAGCSDAFGCEPHESLTPLDDENAQTLFQLFYSRGERRLLTLQAAAARAKCRSRASATR
jgi:hypothetical protein